MLKKTTGRLERLAADTICYDYEGIHIVFAVTDRHKLKLLHFSTAPFEPGDLCRRPDGVEIGDEELRQLVEEAFQPVQVNFSGYNRPYEKQGNKQCVTAPGYMLVFDRIEEGSNAIGDTLTFWQHDDETGARVRSDWQCYAGLPVIRMTNTVTNAGDRPQTLEYISSFAYTGLEKDEVPGTRTFISSDDKMTLVIPYHSWQKELSLKQFRFADLGMAQTQPHCCQRTSRTIEVTNTGHWSTKAYLPLGYIGNSAADTGLFFQIEHNGSWHYEVGDQVRHFFVNVSGPTEVQSHWSKELAPGESFTTVPCAVGACHDSFEEAIGWLTRYRRAIRRPNRDDEELPVIFNDYMNCLFGDPTTEKELPLIDAAARAGCEYYVIDCGWYSAGPWWDNVGEWKESRERFPQGVRQLTDYIRSKGMIPGLWLELEVMGIHCRLAKELPDECFFLRHGRRVYDRSRWQLDFRHPLVIAHANEVIDRIVNEYGAGYIKMDYNIEPGIGTEVSADSVGEGMLEHERAYLAWLDSVFERYPDLVIENCSSGGLRMDYAMLRRYSIQSTSDQEDYLNYATIAMNSAAGVTPEQSAIWSYPLREGDREEVIFNMINAMLQRIHQSGHLAELSPERFDLVREGIATYKQLRGAIRRGVPFWPMGFADNEDKWLAGGLDCGDQILLAVWRRGGEDGLLVDLDRAFPGRKLKVECLYPSEAGDVWRYDSVDRSLELHYPQPAMARLFRITPQ